MTDHIAKQYRAASGRELDPQKLELQQFPPKNDTSEPVPTSKNAGVEAIPLSVPKMAGNEWEYVRDCLDTNWVSSVGSYVDDFERRVAEFVGAKYAVATVNGTSALHVALLVAGVQPGDEVLVPSLTFIASANAVRFAGATPVFIDAESRYWQMDPNLVEQFLERRCVMKDGEQVNRVSGRRIAAIMPVHVLGHPVDLNALRAIAQKYDLPIVEDAAEALGSEYHGQRIGGGSDCEIACFSFNGNKIITTGGGGMIVTSNPDWAKRAKYLTTTAKDDAVEYIHGETGFNYRLPNVLAAMGCAQMELLPSYIDMKRGIAHGYQEQLQSVSGIHLHQDSPDVRSNGWLPTVEVDSSLTGINARSLMERLRREKIQCRPFWQPMHASPAYRDCEAVLSGVADKLYARCLSLPCSVTLTAEQQQRVTSAITNIVSETTSQRRRAA